MATLKCEESTEFLQNKIIETLDIFAPVEMKTIKLKVENQWLTTGIIISLATSNKLYRRASKRKNPNWKAAHKNYKKVLGKVIRKSKDMYYGAVL